MLKYRAVLVDPVNGQTERPIEIRSNSLDDIRTWAYGSQEGGIERPRGVLSGAISESAAVLVYALEERQIDMLTRKGRPK